MPTPTFVYEINNPMEMSSRDDGRSLQFDSDTRKTNVVVGICHFSSSINIEGRNEGVSLSIRLETKHA